MQDILSFEGKGMLIGIIALIVAILIVLGFMLFSGPKPEAQDKKGKKKKKPDPAKEILTPANLPEDTKDEEMAMLKSRLTSLETAMDKLQMDLAEFIVLFGTRTNELKSDLTAMKTRLPDLIRQIIAEELAKQVPQNQEEKKTAPEPDEAVQQALDGFDAAIDQVAAATETKPEKPQARQAEQDQKELSDAEKHKRMEAFSKRKKQPAKPPANPRDKTSDSPELNIADKIVAFWNGPVKESGNSLMKFEKELGLTPQLLHVQTDWNRGIVELCFIPDTEKNIFWAMPQRTQSWNNALGPWFTAKIKLGVITKLIKPAKVKLDPQSQKFSLISVGEFETLQ